MPLNIIHTAVAIVGGEPAFKQYPPGTAFDCTVQEVELRYDYSSGGHVLTQWLRITGARDAEGNAIPYPSTPG